MADETPTPEVSWPSCKAHQRRMSRRHGEWYCEGCLKKAPPAVTPLHPTLEAPRPVADLVVEDLKARARGPAAVERGRDWLVDLYETQLDCVLQLRAEVLRRYGR